MPSVSLDNPTKLASSPYVHQDIEYGYTLVHAYLELGVQAAALCAQLEIFKTSSSNVRAVARKP